MSVGEPFLKAAQRWDNLQYVVSRNREDKRRLVYTAKKLGRAAKTGKGARLVSAAKRLRKLCFESKRSDEVFGSAS